MFVIVYNNTNRAPSVESSTVYFDREEADTKCAELNDAMKPEYQHFSVWAVHPAGMNANVARAAREVEEFVNEYEAWEEGNAADGKTHIATTGEYSTPVRHSLYTEQLRLILTGLKR